MAFRSLLAVVLTCLAALAASAEPLPRETIADHVMPPYSLGEPLNENGVWSLLNSGGAEAGYVFETEPMAPLPGFSGAPINLLVMLDLDGRFIAVQLLSHNEPIFVSGLGEGPLLAFLEQYRGHGIHDSLVLGTPYGEAGAGSGLVYLDGVTKATASVRIANETILAATLQVAREKMQGVASGPPVYPDPAVDEPLTWEDLVAQDLVRNVRVTNAELDALFDGTIWSDDDPVARDDPEAPFLDLWLVDVGPPSIARAVLSADTLAELERFRTISPNDEPLLVIETARHGLVSEDFVRNTAPDRLVAGQDGLPVALRDADLQVELSSDVPDALNDGVAMILRADRRLGFDPTRPWTLSVQAVREHGMFQPEVGSVSIPVEHVTDARFYTRPGVVETLPPWREALIERKWDMVLLAVLLPALMLALWAGQSRLAGLARYPQLRLAILAIVLVFVGWWGQGQLSIVTVLAVLRSVIDGGSLGFLLYDPFSLAIWAAAIVGFVVWGRGLFCGWLCPFGALQEFAHHLGRRLRLPRLEPSARWDDRLRLLKYVALGGLLATVIITPEHADKVAEIEPFKTAITVMFVRDWYYVAYAVFWLVLGLFVFKAFCRFLCPLGAVMAIGGMLRARDWIPRRVECGTPCQLCKVRCGYSAIRGDGGIRYSECFQCLDCVTIHDSPSQCVPLILAARRQGRMMPVAAE